MALIINKLKMVLIVSATCFVNALYSQEVVKQITVPLLKESYKIDSLFDQVLLQKISGPKYFSFDELSRSAIFGILQRTVSEPKIFFRLPKPQYMEKFGYFRYRDCVVFVFRDDDSFGFFKDTNETSQFDFVTEYHDEKEAVPGQLFFKTYYYRIGRFQERSIVLH